MKTLKLARRSLLALGLAAAFGAHAQSDKPIRILALSTSLANAKDVGEWIGATSHGLFNFPPGQWVALPGVDGVVWMVCVEGCGACAFVRRQVGSRAPRAERRMGG